MKFIRYQAADQVFWGEWQGDHIIPWTGAPYAGGESTFERLSVENLHWREPVEPSKIVCVGRNYALHARELGNEIPSQPLLFLKPSSALLGEGGYVELPEQSERVDFEGEIALVVGDRAKDVSVDDAWGYIWGITCMDDVTARDLQRQDKTFTRGKGFDTFAPCGPWVETEFDADELGVTTRVNGEVRQQGTVSDMIFSPAVLVSYISSIMTLMPGDVIATGTPAGVGPLYHGDCVEIEVSSVGTLTHHVKAKS
jgi:2-keto-4-pentenoate hydratase/2-oxohepta-3-ene-1,7-dioic acid hydratase in catechol pathway